MRKIKSKIGSDKKIKYFVGNIEGESEKGFSFPGACNAGDPGSVPRWGKSPGERHGNPLQYSCLEKPMDRGA